MKIRLPMALVTAVWLFIAVAAHAQQPIEMRPDEAFWNAIRDGSSAPPVELFLKAHPDSPYAADARKKLQALGGGEPAPTAPAAPHPEPEPSAQATPPAQAASPPADVASTENAQVEAISFLGVLGLSLRDEAGALVVSAIAPEGEFAATIQPGDRLVSAGGKSVANLMALADQLTFLSFGQKPIELALDRSGSPVKAVGSIVMTERLQLALKGVADGDRSVQMNIWRADEGRFSPELAGSFAILNPRHPFAPTARAYALAFEALRPQASSRDDMRNLESRLKAVGGLTAYWVMAPNVFEALQNFQRSRGDDPTGILSAAQLDALMGTGPAPPPAEAPQGEVLATIDPLQNPAATPEQRLIGASFMRFYGFFVEARPDGLYVTGLAPRSSFAGKLAKGDKLVSANGQAVSTISQFVMAAAANAVPQRKDNLFRLARQGTEFELPLAAPTDSNWNFDVAHAFLSFKDGFEAVQNEMWAPTYDRIFFHIGANFALAHPKDPNAGMAARLSLAFAALNNLGLSMDRKELMLDRLRQRKLLSERSETSGEIVSAIEGYQQFLGQPVTGLLTQAQFDSLIEKQAPDAMVNEIAGLLRENAIDPGLAQAVLDRAITVYQQVLSKWDSPEPTQVLLSLQRHYGMPETGHPDMDLVGLIARETVRLPPGQPDLLQAAFAGNGNITALLMAVLEKADIDKALMPPLLKRIEFVYRQVLNGATGASTSKMIDAIKAHYGLPAGQGLDVAFLKKLLSEDVVLPDESGEDAYTQTGDWRYIKTDQVCVLTTILLDTRQIEGAFLSDVAPRASIHYKPQPNSSSLGFFIGDEKLFAPGSAVTLIQGGTKAPLQSNVAGGYGEKPKADGTISGLITKMFAKSSDVVTLTGRSPFGGTLSFRFSAKGFSKAFRAINEQCADGRLSAWVR